MPAGLLAICQRNGADNSHTKEAQHHCIFHALSPPPPQTKIQRRSPTARCGQTTPSDIPLKEFWIPCKMVYEDAPPVSDMQKSALCTALPVFAFEAAILGVIYFAVQKRRASQAAQANEPLLDREAYYEPACSDRQRAIADPLIFGSAPFRTCPARTENTEGCCRAGRSVCYQKVWVNRCKPVKT